MDRRLIVLVLCFLVVVIAASCASPRVSCTDQISNDTADVAPSLLLIETNEGQGQQVRPIDPVSLADVPGYARIDFNRHYRYIASRDGQKLFVMLHPDDSNPGWKLRVIDLLSWTDSLVDLDIDQMVSGLTLSPDGSALYWLKPTRRDPAHGIPRAYELYRYELTSRELSVIVRFPSTFLPWEIRLMRSGCRLAVYGVPTDVNNLSETAPHVFIVDVTTGRITADVRLNGIKAGQILVETAEKDEPCCHIYRPGLAWDLEEERLYVVHADEDKVTVVDLTNGEVLRQSDIRPRVSMFERVEHWLFPAVEAKLVPGTQRRALLSPDGTRLYAVGLRQEMTKDPDGVWSSHEVPLGLQVIATDNLSQLRHLDLPVSDLTLSPDGKRLLLIGSFEDFSWSGGSEYEDSGLYVFDAERLEELAHLEPGVVFYLKGFSPDSRYAYVSHPAEPSERYWTKVLQVLDLESYRFVAEIENTFSRLLPVKALQK